jgi:hypothetical protein
MLLYNWNKIFETAQGSPLVVFIIFKMLVTRAIPENKYDRIYKFSNTDFSGKSFLVHPDLLLHYSYKYSYREIAQYLALAAMRPYVDYVTTGERTLDVLLCEVSPEFYEDNSLLYIDKGKIHFLYEEATQEIIH